MRSLLAILLGIAFTVGVISAAQHNADIEGNEFAEFEDLGDEDDDEMIVELEMEEDEFMMDNDDEPNMVNNDEFEDDEDDVTIEDEDDEFDEHFSDDEEFENFEKEEKRTKGKGSSDAPDLEITKVPMHLRNNWDSYYLELLMIAGIAAYLLNYMNGKSKNQKLASAWFNSHKDLLESNFALVGDDGQSSTDTSAAPVTLVKESENRYMLWCSGRVCCEGMLVELKLLKRQDLISVMARTMKPATDEIKITVTMNKEDMDSIVLFVGTKKAASRMGKEMQDLSLYCTDRRSGDKYNLSSSFSVLSEMGEVINGILDNKVIACLSDRENMFDYLHISDQFSGPKPSTEEEQPTKMPETKKVLIFNFKFPSGSRGTVKDMENMLPLMKMVVYCMDKVKRFRLSREGKLKADRARAKVSESYMKLAHSQRQEAAQQRREEKRRADKERLMNEEDPDKARKLEEKQHRKDMRKRMNPGAKQVKVRVA
ncbi:PAT complex subunit CCDC47-like [Amphiura filiformis]|uniref:PAT complex subunit CCDC47-like n=1 Tax=Amphiura filiformis TaxID=82378 RepID=UPI003B227B70